MLLSLASHDKNSIRHKEINEKKQQQIRVKVRRKKETSKEEERVP